ncbi:hypothetical protein ElyMa_006606300 [Elysia marginata]|uniref:Uncharacterized protein n=1 Tax=Elysia marginata TaxID=1093978 RepID=A0AAV4IJH8_9GAST|nr:hypothetical protein ElyMa_006606300 [Elysia marginata]
MKITRYTPEIITCIKIIVITIFITIIIIITIVIVVAVITTIMIIISVIQSDVDLKWCVNLVAREPVHCISLRSTRSTPLHLHRTN